MFGCFFSLVPKSHTFSFHNVQGWLCVRVTYSTRFIHTWKCWKLQEWQSVFGSLYALYVSWIRLIGTLASWYERLEIMYFVCEDAQDNTLYIIISIVKWNIFFNPVEYYICNNHQILSKQLTFEKKNIYRHKNWSDSSTDDLIDCLNADNFLDWYISCGYCSTLYKFNASIAIELIHCLQ